MPAPEPQAILLPPSQAAIFLVWVVEPGREADIRDLLAEVNGIRRSVGFRIPEARLSCVTGIGAALWDRLFDPPRPAELHPLPEFAGDRHVAVSTPGDLLFHIRATRLDLCFELAQRLTERLEGRAEVVDEVHGFRSFDERDLLGFVDGTENPEGTAAQSAALIADEDAAFAGGSYVVVQKYLHDLKGWDALSVEAQEDAIGRTKLSNLEFDDDVKPPNSHVALTVIEDENGEEQQILRYNMPFGRVGAGEYGTYFIGYARNPAVIEQMLTNMFVGSPPGATDRILDFSTAATGTLFFVPSSDFLDEPPVPGAGTAATATAPPAGPAADPRDDSRCGSGASGRHPRLRRGERERAHLVMQGVARRHPPGLGRPDMQAGHPRERGGIGTQIGDRRAVVVGARDQATSQHHTGVGSRTGAVRRPAGRRAWWRLGDSSTGTPRCRQRSWNPGPAIPPSSTWTTEAPVSWAKASANRFQASHEVRSASTSTRTSVARTAASEPEPGRRGGVTACSGSGQSRRHIERVIGLGQPGRPPAASRVPSSTRSIWMWLGITHSSMRRSVRTVADSSSGSQLTYPRRTGPEALAEVRRCAAPARARISRASGSSWRPAEVRRTCRRSRTNRSTPTLRSSALICCDSDGAAIRRRSAARPKCSSSATATK